MTVLHKIFIIIHINYINYNQLNKIINLPRINQLISMKNLLTMPNIFEANKLKVEKMR